MIHSRCKLSCKCLFSQSQSCNSLAKWAVLGLGESGSRYHKSRCDPDGLGESPSALSLAVNPTISGTLHFIQRLDGKFSRKFALTTPYHLQSISRISCLPVFSHLRLSPDIYSSTHSTRSVLDPSDIAAANRHFSGDSCAKIMALQPLELLTWHALAHGLP